jgi:hypothetical protein
MTFELRVLSLGLLLLLLIASSCQQQAAAIEVAQCKGKGDLAVPSPHIHRDRAITC